MLLALVAGFSLSQAYRTVAAMMANQLQNDFGSDAFTAVLLAVAALLAAGALAFAWLPAPRSSAGRA
jgi:hypothetical protein